MVPNNHKNTDFFLIVFYHQYWENTILLHVNNTGQFNSVWISQMLSVINMSEYTFVSPIAPGRTALLVGHLYLHYKHQLLSD